MNVKVTLKEHEYHPAPSHAGTKRVSLFDRIISLGNTFPCRRETDHEHEPPQAGGHRRSDVSATPARSALSRHRRYALDVLSSRNLRGYGTAFAHACLELRLRVLVHLLRDDGDTLGQGSCFRVGGCSTGRSQTADCHQAGGGDVGIKRSSELTGRWI